MYECTHTHTHTHIYRYQSLAHYAWQGCCSHSHILPLYLAAGPNLFVVPRMPLLSAQAFLDNHASVNDRMQKELLVMQVSLQVAWALEYLHGEGVLHLDVNPSNVVIRDHGSADMHQQLLEDDGVGGYATPKTPGGTQMHSRPLLKVMDWTSRNPMNISIYLSMYVSISLSIYMYVYICMYIYLSVYMYLYVHAHIHIHIHIQCWAMLMDLGLSSRARDSHTSIDVYSYKDTSKQPQRIGGTPQFWAPEQIIQGHSFWGTYVHTCTMYIHVYICKLVCVHMHTYTYKHVCVYTYIQYMYIYTSIYTLYTRV